jgi:hypothetical protein
MVRSLLDSSWLRRSSGLRFVLMLLGVCLLLTSVPLWLAVADYDYHFSYDRELENPSFYQEIHTSPYEQLAREKKRIVDAALGGERFDFEDDTKDLPAVVRKNGVYHKFASYRAIDWLYPGTLGSILLGFVGLWLTIEAVQHERKHLGPRGY